MTPLFASVLTLEELRKFPASMAGIGSSRSAEVMSDIEALVEGILYQSNKINKSKLVVIQES